jgi:hypothetical protein
LVAGFLAFRFSLFDIACSLLNQDGRTDCSPPKRTPADATTVAAGDRDLLTPRQSATGSPLKRTLSKVGLTLAQDPLGQAGMVRDSKRRQPTAMGAALRPVLTKQRPDVAANGRGVDVQLARNGLHCAALQQGVAVEQVQDLHPAEIADGAPPTIVTPAAAGTLGDLVLTRRGRP